MPKRPGVAAQGLSALINLTSYLTSREDGDETVTRTVRLPRTPADVLDYLSNLHGIPRKDLIDAAAKRLRGMTDQSETLKLLQEVAGQFTFENARTRTLELTQGSFRTLNDIAKRLGVSPDAVIAALLSLVGADLDILRKKRREQVQKALKSVEKLRETAGKTESELIEILGADHPMSWPKLTDGIQAVHDELRHELHGLEGSTPPSTPKKAPSAGKKSAAKRKTAATRAKKAPARKATAKPKQPAKRKTQTRRKEPVRSTRKAPPR